MHKIYLDVTEKALTRMLKRAKFAASPYSRSRPRDSGETIHDSLRCRFSAARQLQAYEPFLLRQSARIFPLPLARERRRTLEKARCPQDRLLDISIVRD